MSCRCPLQKHSSGKPTTSTNRSQTQDKNKHGHDMMMNAGTGQEPGTCELNLLGRGGAPPRRRSSEPPPALVDQNQTFSAPPWQGKAGQGRKPRVRGVGDKAVGRWKQRSVIPLPGTREVERAYAGCRKGKCCLS